MERPEMERRGGIRERDLHAYVDGVLDKERYAAVEAYLAKKPAEARRVADYKRQNRLLRAMGRAAVRART